MIISGAVEAGRHGKEFVIEAEISGAEKKEVKVAVEDGVLTVERERKSEKEENGKKSHRVERSYGNFVRSFTMPENIAEDKLRAEFQAFPFN
jgi:HSP20 family protein